ncbi:MAG TPA: non-homologous end-joining DNA ligase [Candidatus Binatia bacterium]|jgi:bifunctional non-homologous end joining protein LigD|nr:non-homologous end-joining DNA ligase [Candidatus Binatia bacterium]
MALEPGRVTRERRAALPVRVTNPDKVFWPDEGYTKLDLIRYYDFVFPWLAPWVKDRLLALERCPHGLRGRCFFQKEKPASMPPDTPTRRIVHRNGVRNYVVGGRRETQLALANLGCIGVHVWGSRAPTPRQPDWVCIDLDPDSGVFADAARAALRVKAALEALGLVPFAKTSGKRGIHVFAPIRVGPDADAVRDFAGTLGRLLAGAHPTELTMAFPLAARRGRVYLDPGRNGFAQTVAAPYSVRRWPGATVSAPLAWSEVKPSLDPGRLTIRTIAARLARRDPWRAFWRSRRALEPAIEAIARM